MRDGYGGVRGLAKKLVNVCHTDNKDKPDCYRRITVYHEPLGALKGLATLPRGVSEIIFEPLRYPLSTAEDFEAVVDQAYLDFKLTRSQIVEAFIDAMAEIPCEEPLTCEQCKTRPVRFLMVVDWSGKYQHLGRRKMLVCPLCKDYNLKMQETFPIEGSPDGPHLFTYAIEFLGGH
jgi:hypothetical protein